jgi:hypothetical protein
MRSFDLCLIRPHARPGEPSARLGVPLLDEYLRFLSGRCRPNTVLAAAYDLKVFFAVVGKQIADVRPADVLAFVTAQRSGRSSIDGVLQAVDDKRAGVSSSTVRRRLSSVSGLYAFLHARGDVPTNPVLWVRCARIGTERWWRRWCSAGSGVARSWGFAWRNCRWRSGGCSSPRAKAVTSG